MAFDTVNYRRSALNIATFGINALLFIPLTPDGSFSTNDSENVLGYYIGVGVEVTAIVYPEGYTVGPGAIGVYNERAIWQRLGMSYDRVYEFTFSDPVRWIINNAFIDTITVKGSGYFGAGGAIGDYKTKRIWGRLGTSRDRVYEFYFSEPVKWIITNAFIEAS